MEQTKRINYTQQRAGEAKESVEPHVQASRSSSPMGRRFPGWVLLPQRLFLGITFIYAGIQKLTDPQFFHKSTPGYIGNQIIAFAHGSPLHDLLLRVAVPHAALFGLVIAFGEIAIGLGATVGLLFRLASFFGMLLSILFFLTASWHVYPYFYGADIVFAFCWLTLLLNGPLQTGLPTVDGWLASFLSSESVSTRAQGLNVLLRLLLGVPAPRAVAPERYQLAQQTTARIPSSRRQSSAQKNTRRIFLLGALSGGVASFCVVLVGYAWQTLSHATNDDTTLPDAPAATGGQPSGAVPQPSSSAGSPTTSGGTIAQVNAVPKNTATTFTVPSTGDPGVLVHLANDQFVAYDATCTHAGCQVSYDPGSQLLLCPCHGAAFDPVQSASAVRGPTSTPLTTVAIHVDSATEAIRLA